MTAAFHRSTPFWLVLLATGFIASCSKGKTGQTVTAPTTPTPAPAVQPTAVQTYTSLWVLVYDPLLRNLSGATVQLLDGPGAGLSAVTDETGYASFPIGGTVSSSIRLQVTRDGYSATVTTATVTTASYKGPGGGRADVELQSSNPLQFEPGPYMLTITTNGGCANLPTNVQTQQLTASLAPLPSPRNLDGYFVTVEAAVAPYKGFELAVAGLDFGTELDFPEPVATPAGIVAFAGSGTGTAETSPTTTISMPFAYSFLFNGQSCTGENGRFTLTHQ